MPEIRFGQSSAPVSTDDFALTDRIARAYRGAMATPLGSTNSMWLEGPLLDMRRDVHDALMAEDIAGLVAMLRDPGQTDLFHGFEDLTQIFRRERLASFDEESFVSGQYHGLLQLARAVGLRHVRHHDQPEAVLPEVEELLLKLDKLFGFRVDFPNPFPGERGLVTSRGLLSYRAPPALYQAWRLSQLLGGLPAPRVLEIGGGLGRTAYYARQSGITDYTIIDIPITLVAQADFLGRVVGAQHLHLYGEADKTANCVTLMPPSVFLEGMEKYDLILNVDSMTELARETAQAYCAAIAARASIFLSINHEGLSFTVADLLGGKVFQRSPYWMRPGYVEELSGRYLKTAADLSGRDLLRLLAARVASRVFGKKELLF